MTLTQFDAANACHATLVHPRWVLTAAHCFAGQLPLQTDPVRLALSKSVGAPAVHVQDVATEDVFFFPGAFPAKKLLHWTAVVSGVDLDCGHDLALVRLKHPINVGVPGVAVAKLWIPPSCAGNACNVAGLPVSFGGAFSGSPSGYGTVFNKVYGAVSATYFKGENLDGKPTCTMATVSTPMLVVNKQSGLMATQGDSGTGLLALAPQPSTDWWGSWCAFDPPVGAAQGEEALIGVASSGKGPGTDPSETGWVPTFTPEHAQWIQQTVRKDLDDDFVCGNADNCPDHYNPDQQNSNIDAEEAWGSKQNLGKHFGDACDPAPTPVARVLGPSGAAFGDRLIRKQFVVDPVLGVGAPLADTVTPRFCV